MTLSRITGKPIAKALEQERGRLVDAMADSSAHIHGKKFRDLRRSGPLLRPCRLPARARRRAPPMCSRQRNKAWAEKMQALFASSPFGKNCHAYPGKDLWHMRSLLFTEPVDFLIGNTYGKYLERDTGTPLIRIGFPVFDRHHHHRYPVWGYQGGNERAGEDPRQDLRRNRQEHQRSRQDRLQLRHHPLMPRKSLPPPASGGAGDKSSLRSRLAGRNARAAGREIGRDV